MKTMVTINDLRVIFHHSNSIRENESMFQTTLKVVFYEAARQGKLDEEVISFLEKFEISVSTLWRWMQGTSLPHPNVQSMINDWCKTKIKEQEGVHDCNPILFDPDGQPTGYCSICHETLIFSEKSKWMKLKDIQPDHPNTKAVYELALKKAQV